jgi:uncharacterized membrane protein
MQKIRINSWIQSCNEVGRIYANAWKSNKFVGTFLIGILLSSSLGIWLDIFRQQTVQIDNFFTFIVALTSILIIDSFLDKDGIKDELKGVGIIFLGLLIFITTITYVFKSHWIILAYILCLLIYIAIEADKDKYDSQEDQNTLGYDEFQALTD